MHKVQFAQSKLNLFAGVYIYSHRHFPFSPSLMSLQFSTILLTVLLLLPSSLSLPRFLILFSLDSTVSALVCMFCTYLHPLPLLPSVHHIFLSNLTLWMDQNGFVVDEPISTFCSFLLWRSKYRRGEGCFAWEKCIRFREVCRFPNEKRNEYFQNQTQKIFIIFLLRMVTNVSILKFRYGYIFHISNFLSFSNRLTPATRTARIVCVISTQFYQVR